MDERIAGCKVDQEVLDVLRSAKSKKVDVDDVTNISLGEMMDGSVTSEWFGKDRRELRRADGRSRLLSAEDGPKLQQAWFSGREWAHGCPLPMPMLEELDEIELETRALDREAEPGPKARAWLERVDDWVYRLELWFRGTNPKVLGSWKNNIEEWERLLRVLPRKRRERVLSMIKNGVRLPWDGPPPKHLRDPRTGGCPPNNPRILQQRDKVWETLYMQLVEGAVAPWDCKGSSSIECLPRGMYPINWQVKSGTDDVRITCNMRRLKRYLCEKYSKGVDLPSVPGCRFQHIQFDWVVDFDLHSSFFHGAYHKSAFTWLGFSIRDCELPSEAVAYLWKFYPECRFGDRWVFVYHAFAMGASPSVADMQEIMQAVVDACRASGVGSAVGLRPEAWRGFIFIDDIKGSSKGGPVCGHRNGSGFGSAVELGLQLLATLIALGCFVNFRKSSLLPRQKDSVYLGTGHNNVVERFFIAMKRIGKLIRAIKHLRSKVRIGRRVAAKAVARVIGLLWSCQVCCHKAVAIMCRAMTRTITIMLRQPQLEFVIGGPNFKWVLKQAWKGDVVWTVEPDGELRFWEAMPWELLWAPYGYDAFIEPLKDFMRVANKGEMASSCLTIASDASEEAVGGGVFEPAGAGMFECVSFAHHMLRISTKKKASALREMEGIVGTVVASDPPRGSRVLAVVDNEAVHRVLAKGSGCEELQKLAKFAFLYCIRKGILLCSLWQRRSTSIMTFCDTGSRIVDKCAYSAHAGLFWRANAIAGELWGCGFTYDRFGSTTQVQPVNCPWKLPFSSRFRCAFTSGLDALTQDWRNHVNWVNAPFSLVGKILALVRRQRAVAAVVVPRGWKGTRSWWQHELRSNSEGVVHRWDLMPGDPRCEPVRQEVSTQTRRYGLAVVFIDCRRAGSPLRRWKGQPAEVVLREWEREGRPIDRWRYLGVDGEWSEGLPCVTHGPVFNS